MEQAALTLDAEFVLQAAQRAGLDPTLDLLHYVNCGRVVKLCASLADNGGGGRQIMEGVAIRSESCGEAARAFIHLVTAQCASIAGNRTGNEAGDAIRSSFEFLKELADVELLEHQQWSAENPRAYSISLKCTDGTAYGDWLAALNRAMATLAEEFGDNNAVVVALDAADDAKSAGQSTEAGERWDRTVAKARTRAAEGLPEGAITRLGVFAHCTM